jgi:rhamnosyl/mannosyltransferase
MYASDIICFPSVTRNEAFGLTLAEGMYYEKHAVTFTIPGSGVNYVNLDGVTGIECPNCDSKAYAVALKKLATNSKLRKKYGNAARESIR